MTSTPPSQTRIFVDTSVLFAASLSATGFARDLIVAGAIHAAARFLATYDRKHLLAQATLIQTRFGVIVATPEAVLASIA